jgi:hypothetical protein
MLLSIPFYLSVLSSFFLPLVHDKTVLSPLFFHSSIPLSPSLFSRNFLSYPFHSSVCAGLSPTVKRSGSYFCADVSIAFSLINTWHFILSSIS